MKALTRKQPGCYFKFNVNSNICEIHVHFQINVQSLFHGQDVIQ